jgi:hypothetical protein
MDDTGNTEGAKLINLFVRDGKLYGVYSNGSFKWEVMLRFSNSIHEAIQDELFRINQKLIAMSFTDAWQILESIKVFLNKQ